MLKAYQRTKIYSGYLKKTVIVCLNVNVHNTFFSLINFFAEPLGLWVKEPLDGGIKYFKLRLNKVCSDFFFKFIKKNPYKKFDVKLFLLSFNYFIQVRHNSGHDYSTGWWWLSSESLLQKLIIT